VQLAPVSAAHCLLDVSQIATAPAAVLVLVRQ
jgi:hypothetical protein